MKRGIVAVLCVAGVVCGAFGGVTLTDNETYAGTGGHYKVVTDVATYYYHKAGGTFTGLVDNDDSDWISWSTAGGASGQWRGMPKPYNWGWNAEDAGGSGVETGEPQDVTAEYAKITSSKGGTADIEFFPTHVTFTITSNPGNFYFTYEGTPNGECNESETYTVKGNETTQNSIGSDWTGDIGEADDEDYEWLYIGHNSGSNVLFITHSTSDNSADNTSDLTHKMCPMWVFGFGRGWPTTGHISGNDSFTFGIVESTDHDEIVAAVKAAMGATKARHATREKAARDAMWLRQAGTALHVNAPFNGQHTVTIHDLAGRILVSQVSSEAASVVNTASLPSGSYVVKAAQGGHVVTGRISKF
ncbi:MAG: T9SS type A sorting domain-containing protein [Chitinivibrionales bacterium]|nr:T9SS type A sorting domain-containing protein [Chitinivibrionales bacterium]MBD3396170.1 T9SS type A sorting domain-containing protein [Chitinivibrionales bacterium]